MALTKLTTSSITGDTLAAGDIAADAITASELADNAVDTAALAADAVTGAKIADDALNSEHYTDGSIDTAHIADDQITLAKMASGTDGNIISYDASGNPVAIATGNDGQVLTSTGAGSPPAFEDAGGGLVFINEASASSDVGSIILDNVFTSTYQNYLLIGEMTPANNNVEARFLFRTGGSSGSDLTGSQYGYSFVLGKSDVSTYNSTQATGAGSCGFAPDVNNNTDRVGVRLAWTVLDPFSTKRTTLSGTGKYTQSDANFASFMGACDYKDQTSITGIKFYFNSGNINPAHFRVYGIVNS